jgi:YidC/Oxa1 family membrane protein insertase
MDFGIGFLSNNVMLPILDFFYGIVPSYGLAIVALTLVIRFALFPLSAGSIRSMRRMKVAQPVMQKRVKEVQERYKDDPSKQQEEMSKIYKEFGNPLSGCFPVLLQMPILFALFATLRGSPFADINYSVDLQILPTEKIEQIQPQAFSTKPKNIYLTDGFHVPVAATIPGGNKLGVGEKTSIEFRTSDGQSLETVLAEHPDSDIQPQWTVESGQDKVAFDERGNLIALAPGDVTLKADVPGIAANKGFLFIKALGRVGARNDDGSINWDIVGMVLFFGLSLYANQLLSGQNSSAASSNPQQDTINKVTPVLFSGMFLFFPLPAGVLMYMVIANIFQTLQTFILSREPLPENLQKIVDEQEKKGEGGDRKTLPFEPASTKKESDNKRSPKGKGTPSSPSAKTNSAKSKGNSKSQKSSKPSGSKASSSKASKNP